MINFDYLKYLYMRYCTLSNAFSLTMKAWYTYDI